VEKSQEDKACYLRDIAAFLFRKMFGLAEFFHKISIHLRKEGLPKSGRQKIPSLKCLLL